MLEFLANYGPIILAGLTALGAAAGSVYNITKIFKIGKKVNENIASTKEDIQITREGIVEAFKTAKIPSEWKISVSNQVKTILDDSYEKFITTLERNEAIRNKMMVKILTILSNTAAANKLTEEEKTEISDLIKLITDEDSTIDITE